MGLKLRAQARWEVIQKKAPHYQQVSAASKGTVLDEVVAITGYARRTAQRLLNHPPQGVRPPKRHRQASYGREVQEVLFLLWHYANRICSKRLMPFLPTWLEALERHHHLQVSQECRSQLLAMSAATADRLLRTQRTRHLGSPSTTRAGTWLKQQIPIRTFAQWNEITPGFLEVDLVAHCGAETKGSFLFTLTLTDIATGWTECLPLHSKTAEEVLSALQQARTRFPFPILGLDSDNGYEFIHELLLPYCEQEELTFTRGRPDLKNDQCFIEQKNGAVVRQVIGHERMEGEALYQRLGELYQALRLYVNWFQPSMKLQATSKESKKVRRVYDAAKTPVQRLLLSHVLSAAQEDELLAMTERLDPLRLFAHLQALQQALFEQVFAPAPASSQAGLAFCLEQCLPDPHAACFQTMEPAWQQQQEVLSAHVATPTPSCNNPEQEGTAPVSDAAPLTCASAPCAGAEEAGTKPQVPGGDDAQSVTGARTDEGQPRARDRSASRKRARHTPSPLTIEQAVADYLADQISQHRRPKTLEWHEMALRSLQHYLRTQHDCLLVHQISPSLASGWLTFLQELPGAKGSLRTPGTLHSYARSARAFCRWMSSTTLFQRRLLPTSLFLRQRRLTLGHEGLSHLLAYLDGYRLTGDPGKLEENSQEPLFLSEEGHPLTKGGVTLVFGRLRKRAGITRTGVTAALLRESFALRSLQTGGDASLLPEVLGQQDCRSLLSRLYDCQETRGNEQRTEITDGEGRCVDSTALR